MSRSKRLSEGEAAKALALSLNKGSGSEASLNSPEQRLERIEACANVSGDQDMGDLDWLLRVARAAVAWRDMLKDDDKELVRIFAHNELAAILRAVESE